MKSFLYTIFFLFLCHSIYSQFAYSIDLVVGPEYSYRNLLVTDDAANVDQDILQRNLSLRDGETAKRNFRFGFNFNKYIDNGFYFKSGLRYVSGGYNGEKQTDIEWPSEVDENGNYTPDPALFHENQFIYNFRFIEIPGIFRYHISDGRFAPFIEAGLSLHIYAHTITKQITEFGTTVNKFHDGEANGDLSTVGVFSIGFEYLLNTDYALFFQTAGRYHLVPRRQSVVIQDHLYNFGVEFGMRRRLGPKKRRNRRV